MGPKNEEASLRQESCGKRRGLRRRADITSGGMNTSNRHSETRKIFNELKTFKIAKNRQRAGHDLTVVLSIQNIEGVVHVGEIYQSMVKVVF